MNSGKDIIDIINASITSITALALAMIAYRQWRTADNLRKQNLFDKRYNLYIRLWKLYSSHIENPNDFAPLDFTDVLDYTHEATFLFGNDIVKLILSMPDKQLSMVLDYDWFSKPFEKYMKLN
jgi:hypothetical protein